MSKKNTKPRGINLTQEELKKGGRCNHYKTRPLYNLTESGNQSLCQPEAEDQLGTCHQQLGGQTLEEAGGTLVFEHL